MKYIIAIFLITSVASAHEMVPTYPKISGSYVEGLQKTTMTMFNKRMDVEYYEIGVFTEEWKPIPFVSQYKVWKIPYLSTVSFDIFIRDQDAKKATYICSQSKLKKENTKRTAVSSRICSRVKKVGEE
jgi:hypothetical protein